MGIMNPVNISWIYYSASGSQLLSLTISFNLQDTIADMNIPQQIKNQLGVNNSHIFPSGFILSHEYFNVLAFQPNCK